MTSRLSAIRDYCGTWREATSSELAAHMGLPVQKIAGYLSALHHKGYIDRRPTGNTGVNEVRYLYYFKD